MSSINSINSSVMPLGDVLEPENFAILGAGHLGYIRKMKSDDLISNYPSLTQLEGGQDLWVLFSASGMPMLLTDHPSAAVAGALQNKIQPVALN